MIYIFYVLILEILSPYLFSTLMNIYLFYLQANSETACERACTFETEFLCRSYLYLGAPTGSDYNCKLYHLDHWTIPAGISAFLNSQTPLVGDGSRIGKYYENRCERKLQFFLHAALLSRTSMCHTFYFGFTSCVFTCILPSEPVITGSIFTWKNSLLLV